MSAALDYLIKETLEDLADAPPPTGLASGAMRRARRQRAARVGLTALAVTVTAAVAVPLAVNAAAGPAGRAPSMQPAAPPSKALVVTAYSGLRMNADEPGDELSLVLNPETGRYDEVPYGEAIPSPDGGSLLVVEGNNGVRNPTKAAIIDRATGNRRQIKGYGGYDQAAAWSPDGRQILFTRRPKNGTAGFVLVDTTTLKERFVPVPDVRTSSSMGLGFFWTPDGRTVALTLSHAVGNEALPDQVTGIRFYDLTGKPVRTIEVTAGALESGASFSPDGSAIALSPPDNDDPIVVVKADTGAELARIPAASADVDLVGWYDESRLVLRGPAAAGQGKRVSVKFELRVVDLDGTVVRRAPLVEFKDGQYWPTIHLGPADGLAGEAAKHAF